MAHVSDDIKYLCMKKRTTMNKFPEHVVEVLKKHPEFNVDKVIKTFTEIEEFKFKEHNDKIDNAKKNLLKKFICYVKSYPFLIKYSKLINEKINEIINPIYKLSYNIINFKKNDNYHKGAIDIYRNKYNPLHNELNYICLSSDEYICIDKCYSSDFNVDIFKFTDLIEKLFIFSLIGFDTWICIFDINTINLMTKFIKIGNSIMLKYDDFEDNIQFKRLSYEKYIDLYANKIFNSFKKGRRHSIKYNEILEVCICGYVIRQY
jgi:hypothetical protein